MHKLIKTTVFGLALALAACGGDAKDPAAKGGDKGGDKGDKGDKKTAAAGAQTDAGGEQVEAPPALDPKVEQAVGLANRISAEPDKADSILEEAGMDREQFEKLLYEIARDPELSKSYAVAREA